MYIKDAVGSLRNKPKQNSVLLCFKRVLLEATIRVGLKPMVLLEATIRVGLKPMVLLEATIRVGLKPMV